MACPCKTKDTTLETPIVKMGVFGPTTCSFCWTVYDNIWMLAIVGLAIWFLFDHGDN